MVTTTHASATVGASVGANASDDIVVGVGAGVAANVVVAGSTSAPTDAAAATR